MTRIVRDHRPDFVATVDGVVYLLQRRRPTCANLNACEEEWIADPSRRSQQAQCPLWCRAFVERNDTPPDVSIPSSAGGVAW